jgi:hypothetical protein
MDRIFLTIVYASLVVLVVAVALIGATADGPSREYAVARIARQ